jgi:hypothetical protein
MQGSGYPEKADLQPDIHGLPGSGSFKKKSPFGSLKGDFQVLHLI